MLAGLDAYTNRVSFRWLNRNRGDSVESSRCLAKIIFSYLSREPINSNLRRSKRNAINPEKTSLMQLDFERGDADRPCGHAIVYFRDSTDNEKVGVTYVVILPVPLDIGKYMPPFLAGQVAEMSANVISSFAFPPAPEPFDSIDEAERVATARGDDLVYAGLLDFNDAFEMMERVNEASTEYGRMYSEAHGDDAELDAAIEGFLGGDADFEEDDVYDLMYGGMEEADLLTELSTQIGRLRFSVEGGDSSTASETEAKIRAIGRFLPSNREVSKIVAVATSTSPRASQLVQLYVDRAYCLYREDYLRLKKIEEDIAGINSDD